MFFLLVCMILLIDYLKPCAEKRQKKLLPLKDETINLHEKAPRFVVESSQQGDSSVSISVRYDAARIDGGLQARRRLTGMKIEIKDSKQAVCSSGRITTKSKVNIK